MKRPANILKNVEKIGVDEAEDGVCVCVCVITIELEQQREEKRRREKAICRTE